MSRTAPLTSKHCILYIYSTNVSTEYFKHALYSPFFPSSKCSLFHNANLFGSCIIHILHIGCAEIKKKKYNSGAKWLRRKSVHLVGLYHVYHVWRQELGDFRLLLPIFKLRFHTAYSSNDFYIYVLVVITQNIVTINSDALLTAKS